MNADRLRVAILVLLMVVVFAGIAAPAVVINFNQQAATRVSCVSAKANIQQLAALDEISHRLGIPHDFTVPALPSECE
jgi:uncharacterized protein (UPF0333 family)